MGVYTTKSCFSIDTYYKFTQFANGIINIPSIIYSKRQLSNQFFSWWAKNAWARDDPNGDPIATPSICLYTILLPIKNDSLVAKDKFFKFTFFKPWTMSLFLKRLLGSNFNILASRGVLVKRESTSKLPMKLLESCSTISVAS